MKRGEIWTVAGGPDYAGKPRPAVILQDDRFDRTSSITFCAFTSDPTEAPLFRILIEPSERNGLRADSRLMADRITTVPKTRIGKRVGQLDDEDLIRLNRAIVVFLGLAGGPPNA
ncbi:MAG TPA: type II toxin-antitoxin system PemK/MazF family toxin [Gemmatimonadales bacterium]|nr:type II toxin-antitoxin system PemK/MazF family toxin [Gemmatimonadales bacterium]